MLTYPVLLGSELPVYQRWKVRLNDDGLGPQPDLIEFDYLVNETLRWIYNKEYDKLLPYGGKFQC